MDCPVLFRFDGEFRGQSALGFKEKVPADAEEVIKHGMDAIRAEFLTAKKTVNGEKHEHRFTYLSALHPKERYASYLMDLCYKKPESFWVALFVADKLYGREIKLL